MYDGCKRENGDADDESRDGEFYKHEAAASHSDPSFLTLASLTLMLARPVRAFMKISRGSG